MNKKLDFSVDKKEFSELKKKVNGFIELLKKHVRKQKVDADVFLGGSFAKGTLARSDEYDADIFVRFGWKYEDLSKYLERILRSVVRETKFNMKKLHGSRDYFRLSGGGKLTFEVIPVLRIKKVREARNVTDLSYFHVNYVKRNLKNDMKKQMALAKKFCEAQRVYGAESYINGFSGYGLECLVIHYKTFEKMLKDLIKVKGVKRKVIDIAKHYKKKDNVFFEVNESKLHGPIILIDPTWKERNVLAALSWETFKKFQNAGKKFLKNQSERYFEKKEFDIGKMQKKKGEFLHIVLETDRQEGDIAGTKMKKFSVFLERELGRYFDVLGKEFVYCGEGHKADFYLVLKKKKEVLRVGPPLKMKDEVKKFKAKNRGRVVQRKGLLYAKEKIGFSGKEFLRGFDKKKIGEMGIVRMKVLQ